MDRSFSTASDVNFRRVTDRFDHSQHMANEFAPYNQENPMNEIPEDSVRKVANVIEPTQDRFGPVIENYS